MRTFQGSITALTTPFVSGSQAVDFPTLRALIERQLDAGTEGLVVAGTTGESATLTATERQALFEFTVGVVRRRVPVLAGVGTNATRSTIENAQRAQAAGVDGCLIVTPYYNKPTQRGLAHHFETVARNARLPIVLYNVPSRTGVDLAPETTLEVATKLPNIVAIKEATTPERVKELAEHNAIDILCGEDAWIVDGMHAGACGVISVLSNVVPEEVASLIMACRAHDDVRAADLVEKLAPLADALFAETNPAPVKHALHLLGWLSEELRSPLTPISPETQALLREAMSGAGLLP